MYFWIMNKMKGKIMKKFLLGITFVFALGCTQVMAQDVKEVKTCTSSCKSADKACDKVKAGCDKAKKACDKAKADCDKAKKACCKAKADAKKN